MNAVKKQKLEQFRESRVLGISDGFDEPALLYMDGSLEINISDEEYCLTIANTFTGGGDKSGETLCYLEEKLFDWAWDEGYFDNQ